MATSKTLKITIDGDRFGAFAGVGVNGRQMRIPTGQEVEVDEGVIDALRNSGASFKISGEEDGALNAVSVSRVDPPLTGGPKVVVGEVKGKKADDASVSTFRAGSPSDKKELGDGVTVDAVTMAPGDNPAATDYSHDTGGTSAPTPGSRDTIATSDQPKPTARKAKK